MKTGLRTTEFWLALIVALLGGLASIYAEAEWARVAGMLAAALSSAGYGFARAKVKVAVPASYSPRVQVGTPMFLAADRPTGTAVDASTGGTVDVKLTNEIDPHRYDNPGGTA